MTTERTVLTFLAFVAEQPNVGAEFVRARDLWQTAQAAKSRELAEAAGQAFSYLVDLYGIARGRPVDSAEREILRDMVQSQRTAAERVN